MSASNLDISVIICTRDRAESLRETLACLARADRSGLQVEVLVVDNGSGDGTAAVVQSFAGQLPVRLLRETKQGTYGKSHSLNCALESGRLGELIVVLDDDISVELGWWHGVNAISRRWPGADLFTGRTLITWPPGELPAWVHQPRIKGWIFSGQDGGSEDRTLTDGQWFLGGHFWFRSRVLAGERRFPDVWFTEPHFMLQLVEDGFRGVAGGDAVASHRIQNHLLDPQNALERAESSGRAFARTRLCPCRATIRNARWARNHPILARVGCAGLWFKWTWRVWRLRGVGGDDVRFGDRLVAVERRSNYREVLRILWSIADYQVLSGRHPRFQPYLAGSAAAAVGAGSSGGENPS